MFRDVNLSDSRYEFFFQFGIESKRSSKFFFIVQISVFIQISVFKSFYRSNFCYQKFLSSKFLLSKVSVVQAFFLWKVSIVQVFSIRNSCRSIQINFIHDENWRSCQILSSLNVRFILRYFMSLFRVIFGLFCTSFYVIGFKILHWFWVRIELRWKNPRRIELRWQNIYIYI